MFLSFFSSSSDAMWFWVYPVPPSLPLSPLCQIIPSGWVHVDNTNLSSLYNSLSHVATFAWRFDREIGLFQGSSLPSIMRFVFTTILSVLRKNAEGERMGESMPGFIAYEKIIIKSLNFIIYLWVIHCLHCRYNINYYVCITRDSSV